MEYPILSKFIKVEASDSRKFKLDSYGVKQYENERVVDTVTLDESEKFPFKKKYVLVYSPLYRANILAPARDLTEVEASDQ